ncbi:MAG: beta-ketoacyl-[acyl-carrier-protein] synthase family protein [Spirochaetaceae bacterium]|nr:beta-ketoacyl-[acyl-carrier-protein] synthase family protein [Spirochaetaceae bacterium]
MKNKRVVVTGLGVVSALGNSIEAFEENLRTGKSGIKKITRFKTEGLRNDHAGEVSEFEYPEGVDDRCLAFTFNAVEQALRQSALNIDEMDLSRIGVSIATSLGCAEEVEEYIKARVNGKRPSLNMIDNVPHGKPAATVAAKYDLSGPVVCIDTACASGSSAIGYAYELLQSNRSDIVIAGGVDILNILSFSGFNCMMNLSKDITQPFNIERPGLMLGEGCGIAILETYESAISRKADILAEVRGYGLSNDAFHETKPDPLGGGAVRSMLMAINEAGIEKNNIQYINAHGTGTKFNDPMEMNAIRTVFGEHGENIKISSIKAALGHTLGAAGGIEFVSTVLNIHKGFVSPTINFEKPMSGYEKYDFVPNRGKECEIDFALSNSFGFGGNCCSVLLSRFMETRSK